MTEAATARLSSYNEFPVCVQKPTNSTHSLTHSHRKDCMQIQKNSSQ